MKTIKFKYGIRGPPSVASTRRKHSNIIMITVRSLSVIIIRTCPRVNENDTVKRLAGRRKSRTLTLPFRVESNRRRFLLRRCTDYSIFNKIEFNSRETNEKEIILFYNHECHDVIIEQMSLLANNGGSRRLG